ncbi:Ribosomal protein 50S-L18Ae/60S-L20/60S-L18A [Arabidopsis thaliana x Arabidopsis arenosa]|uniref:Ribosomal protein 50S-L18Ae/60S-L20/60S-L18A n=1 Tax=Arabidopsis thaliana x Arabidopsis arenosa TaxID=1240361 RepID=A0A8T1XF41_9BRAS|nr:Ribosomal protein 50S-L18Ae/60S-L20/60S-L18A [Arabidopsis thaliana x Arabidopsis arenosa]
MLLQGKSNKLVDDSIAELKQLQEADGIDEYHARFELISTRVNLSEAFLIMMNRFLSGSDLVENEVEKVKNDLVEIDVAKSCDYEQFSDHGGVFGFNIEECETDSWIENHQLIQEQAEIHSTDSVLEPSLDSSDLLSLNGEDSPPQTAIRSESAVGKTDSSSQDRSELCTKKEEEVKGWIQEQANNHSTNSLLYHSKDDFRSSTMETRAKAKKEKEVMEDPLGLRIEKLENKIAEHNSKMEKHIAEMFEGIHMLSAKDGDDYRKGVMPLNVSSKATGTSKSNDGICMIDNDEDRFLSGSDLVENEVEKVKNDLVEIDVAKSCDYEQFSNNGGVFGFNIEECETDSWIEHHQLIQEQAEIHSTDSVLEPSPDSSDLLSLNGEDSPTHTAIRSESAVGKTDSSSQDRSELCTKKEEEVKGWIQEQANNHLTNSLLQPSLVPHMCSLLKQQVSISHLEFSHRSPIGSVDVYEDLSAIVRSQFDLECAASIALQVFHSMPLRTKLLQNLRKKRLSKTWWFKFKEIDVMEEDVQHVVLSFLQMSAIKTRYDIGDHDEMFKVARTVSVKCMLGLKFGITVSDAGHGENYVYARIIMVKEQLSHYSLVIQEVMRSKKIKFFKRWWFKYHSKDDFRSSTMETRAKAKKEKEVMEDPLGLRIEKLENKIAEHNSKMEKHIAEMFEGIHMLSAKDGDDYRKGVMPLNVSSKATGTSKSNDGICMIDNDEDRFLSGSDLVENEVEKVKNDLVEIDVAKSCDYEQFSNNGGVFGFNIEECETDSWIEHHQLIQEQAEIHSTDSVLEPSLDSSDLLSLNGEDSPTHTAIRSESAVGKTDSSSQDRSELCTKKEEEMKGWIQEQANNHLTNSLLQPSLVPHMCSLLKQQVSISHLEFSHRSPIGSVDVYEDLSAIVRSQFDLECAASIALQVFHSMPLRTKLLQNLRKKSLSKTWWFKFKEIDVMEEDVQHVVLSFLQISAINTRYDIGDHDEMFKVARTVSVKCMLGLKFGITVSDAGHGENYVYARIIMVKEQLSHYSLVIQELMRSKKIKFSKRWWFKYHSKDDSRSSTMETRAKAKKEKEAMEDPLGLRIEKLENKIAEHNLKMEKHIAEMFEGIHMLSAHDWVSYKMLLQGKSNKLVDDSIAELKQLQEADGIDEYHARFELISTRVNLSEAFLIMMNRFLSGSDLVENEVEKVKNDLVEIDVAKSCDYEQFSDHGGVFGFNIEEYETDSWIENHQLIQEQAEIHSTDSVLEPSLDSSDLLSLNGEDSPPQTAIRSESAVGKTDSSSQDRSELCTKKEEEVKGWIQEQANNHSTNSLLSPIGSVDVYEDLSAIVRSQFDLECAASIALQVFYSMPLRTKLLQNLRKKRLSKTWWFKFKEIDVMQEDVQHVVLSFLQMSATKTRYDIGDHDEMFKVARTVSVKCMLGLKFGITVSDAGHGENYVYARIIMVKEQLSHYSLVIQEVMRSKKIKFSKRWWFKYHSKDDSRSSTMETRAKAKKEKEAMEDPVGLRIEKLENKIAEHNLKMEKHIAEMFEGIHMLSAKDGDDYRKGVMPLNVSSKATGTSKSNDGICKIDNDEDRFLSGSDLVENEVEKVKNDLVEIDVAKSCDYEQFSDNGGVFGFNIEECETDSWIEHHQLIQEQAEIHSTDSVLEPSLDSSDLLSLNGEDSPPQTAIRSESAVSISHLEFSHRSPIGSVDVYEDLSAIVRSQFDLECAASIALQVFYSMPLRTKLLQNLRKKRLSKTWWFKFKEIDVMQEDVQHVVLSFLQMSATKTRYDIGDHDEMFKVARTVSVKCMLGLKFGITVSDAGHGENYVYARIIMVKEQLSHYSLVIQECKTLPYTRHHSIYKLGARKIWSMLKEFCTCSFVGRALPTEKDDQPKIYRMKLWATNGVLAKSKFWRQKKVNKSNGQMLAINELIGSQERRTFLIGFL